MRKLYTISTRVEDEDRELIEAFCNETDMSISQLIRKAIRYYIYRYNGEEDQEMDGMHFNSLRY